ncbi:unnamed protein product [Symbiodinium sp. CCMP2592]|nr:unnamed protein product [Symbiodinium sp. CCMP2592]
MTGTFQCPECRQKFDSEKAKQLHWKFIHDPNRLQHAPASYVDDSPLLREKDLIIG